MAHIATIEILVNEDNKNHVYDGLNEILREAQVGGPNGEFRNWVVDWRFGAVKPVSGSLSESIANGTYTEGDAFKGQGFLEFDPFDLVVEICESTDLPFDEPRWARLLITQEFLHTLEHAQKLCKEENLESVSVSDTADFWDKEEDLGIYSSSLRVWGGDFWFEASTRHEETIETCPISISDLRALCQLRHTGNLREDTDLPSDFCMKKGIVFYGTDPSDLAETYFEG